MNADLKTHLGLSGIQENKAISEEKEASGLIKKPFLKKKQQVQEAMSATTKKSEEEKITSLKVVVIDDTALILQTLLPMPKSHPGPHAPSSSRRRRRNQQAMKEEKKKKKQHVRKKQKETIKYSRAELEALRFVNSGGQKRLWENVYRGIGPVVAKEYDDLAISYCSMKKMDQPPPALLGLGAARGRLNQMNVCALKNGLK